MKRRLGQKGIEVAFDQQASAGPGEGRPIDPVGNRGGAGPFRIVVLQTLGGIQHPEDGREVSRSCSNSQSRLLGARQWTFEKRSTALLSLTTHLARVSKFLTMAQGEEDIRERFWRSKVEYNFNHPS